MRRCGRRRWVTIHVSSSCPERTSECINQRRPVVTHVGFVAVPKRCCRGVVETCSSSYLRGALAVLNQTMSNKCPRLMSTRLVVQTFRRNRPRRQSAPTPNPQTRTPPHAPAMKASSADLMRPARTPHTPARTHQPREHSSPKPTTHELNGGSRPSGVTPLVWSACCVSPLCSIAGWKEDHGYGEAQEAYA